MWPYLDVLLQRQSKQDIELCTSVSKQWRQGQHCESTTPSAAIDNQKKEKNFKLNN